MNPVNTDVISGGIARYGYPGCFEITVAQSREDEGETAHVTAFTRHLQTSRDVMATSGSAIPTLPPDPMRFAERYLYVPPAQRGISSTYNLDVLGSHLGRDTGYPANFRVLPQFLWQTIGTAGTLKALCSPTFWSLRTPERYDVQIVSGPVTICL
jgi:hypothetical protein